MNVPVADAYVALGSNLGDRLSHLSAAAEALANTAGVDFVAGSRVYETDPVGPGDQGPYLNAVLHLRTRLEARALLELLQEIERARGRRRSGVRNEARSLDLDLLLYADACRMEPGLVVPHPRLHERAFVLEPLHDVAADVVHPKFGESVADLRARVRDPSAVRIFLDAKELSWPSLQ